MIDKYTKVGIAVAATLQDVAHLAGVNPSTVSRVLNGKSVISSETRERVLAAIEKLDYHPNSLARSLASGQAGAIGVVLDAQDVGAFQNPFFSASQFAIEQYAQDQGYHVMVANGGRKSGNAVERLVLERKVDGLIMPPSTGHPELLKKLTNFPYVFLGQPDENGDDYNWVDIDNEYGALIAVEHLVSKGYRRIAYLGGSQRSDAGFIMRRQKGYLKGIPEGEPHWLLATDGTPENAYEVAMACLQGEQHPDAFLLDDNMAGIGLIKACRELGLSIPQDIGAVTFNNFPMAAYTDPPLTAIDINTGLLGTETAQMLFECMKDAEAGHHKLIKPSLIVRESTQKK